MKNQKKIYVPFSKVDEEQRMVYGYCTTDALDSQGEIVDKMAVRKAWDDYMKFANIREMHEASAVGVAKEYQHDQKGTWLGAKIVDDDAWKKCKEGVYKGFSIGGRVLGQDENHITDLQLCEISVVDRPANEEAVFEMVKRNDAGKLQYVNKIGKLSIVEKSKVGSFMKQLKELTKMENEEKKEGENQDEKVEEKTPDNQPAPEEKAEEKVEEKEPVEEGAEEEAGEEEGSEEKSDAQDETQKMSESDAEDTEDKADKTMTLADVLSHLKYVRSTMSQDLEPGATTDVVDQVDKAIGNLQEALKTHMETDDGNEDDGNEDDGEEDDQEAKAETIEDLSKLVKGQLSKFEKAVLSKVGSIASDVKNLKGRVETIAKSPKADRPKVAFTVNKGIQENAPNALEALRTREKELIEKINNVATRAKAVMNDPQQMALIENEMKGLRKEFSAVRVEIQKVAR